MQGMKYATTFFLGVIAPTLILVMAYLQIGSTSDSLNEKTTTADVITEFKSLQDIGNGNDYQLLSLMLVEHGNIKTVENKQRMKVAVICIGFAVISVGLAVFVLGFKEPRTGPTDLHSHNIVGEAGGMSIDIRTSSTGVLVFVVGAIMATIGGVLPNTYQGSGIPGYIHTTETSVIPAEVEEMLALLNTNHNAYKDCKQTDIENCFETLFAELNSEYLK
ncbi:hypothetical protein [Paraglaciecola sp. L3A3]|uniref:hypothetical protein n=1 Tax=Paraglaciecola sp. L3A3 TaxID=2686358 RepID=UPI00131CB80F|nr:hypothetical protein [Paraglaciecola sp. L3A3]